MSFDIYGNNLRRGHCEVHPHVHEEYPCSVCIDESNARKRAEDQLQREHDEFLDRQYEIDQLRAELEKERERVRRYREDLARCRHQASYSVGNDDALKAQLGKVREIVNDALSAGEGGYDGSKDYGDKTGFDGSKDYSDKTGYDGSKGAKS